VPSATSTYSCSPRTRPPLAKAVITRPFHAVRTLSSLNGLGTFGSCLKKTSTGLGQHIFCSTWRVSVVRFRRFRRLSSCDSQRACPGAKEVRDAKAVCKVSLSCDVKIPCEDLNFLAARVAHTHPASTYSTCLPLPRNLRPRLTRIRRPAPACPGEGM